VDQSSGLKALPADTEFSGLKVLSPFNQPDRLDEVVVFQGASYFRALGQKLRYGLSARGLALNTPEFGHEEFPDFTEFWIEKPVAGAKELTIYALLESPSVAGAYRFVVRPGSATVMQVKAAIYARAGANLSTFGVAPLTSMFWHGENSPSTDGDLRPEVHDSDGLLIERGGGEWLWRPLVNPAKERVATFTDENPRGFGLIQRDRQFESYQDLEAFYHLRPSVWVEPVGAWGRGAVRLVELPTPGETADNIVAFWQPEQLPVAGQAVQLEYRLHWFQESAGGRKPPAGYAVATRIGRSKTQEPELTRFWIDFDGPYLGRHPADPTVEPVVTVGEGAMLANPMVQKNPFNGTWRVAFAIKPDGSGRPVELRCYLRKKTNILTETWSYQWNP
jgi:glucans biosynthesis protein